MDLWSNHIGRQYGKKIKSREELLKQLHKALDNGELIIDPKDSRKFEGASQDPTNKSRPVIVLQEDENGRNLTYLRPAGVGIKGTTDKLGYGVPEEKDHHVIQLFPNKGRFDALVSSGSFGKRKVSYFVGLDPIDLPAHLSIGIKQNRPLR